MIGWLISLLSLLFTPLGFLSFAAGIAMFILAPFLARATNRFHFLPQLHLWLGAQTIERIGAVVTEQGEILLKRMVPDDIGTERIKFNDEVKEFGDPHQAKSTWLGVPFALADEVHGVLFDPIDAALGRRKKELREQNEMVVKATASERDMYGVLGWVNGVLEFPKGTYELPNLTDARRLIMGIERASHPHRIKEFYKNSQDPYNDTSATKQFLLLIVAIAGPFMLMWIAASQLSTSGGGSTVGFGVLVLLVSTAGAAKEHIKTALIAIVVLAPFVGLFAFLAMFVNTIYAVFIFVLMGMGFWLIPAISQVLRLTTSGSEAIAPLLLKLGMTGYDEPVFELTPRGYRTREFKNLEDVDEETVTWHRFLKRRVGFTFTPDPSAWGTEVVDAGDVESRLIDRNSKTNVPAGYKIMPDRKREVYGVFAPNSVVKNAYYVATDIAFGRFATAARGEKSHKRWDKAKEEFGGGKTGISDKSMMIAMAVSSAFSLLLGVVVFFLL